MTMGGTHQHDHNSQARYSKRRAMAPPHQAAKTGDITTDIHFQELERAAVVVDAKIKPCIVQWTKLSIDLERGGLQQCDKLGVIQQFKAHI